MHCWESNRTCLTLCGGYKYEGQWWVWQRQQLRLTELSPSRRQHFWTASGREGGGKCVCDVPDTFVITVVCALLC